MIGVGATIVMDLWAVFLNRVFSIPSLGYHIVGRWLANIPAGKFRRANILNAASVPGEAIIGWTAHYVIGVIFAAILLLVIGADWALKPTFLPALLMGVVTVAAPFLIMQPGFGFGIAASKTPAANTARLRSLMTHTVFGVGLYIAALLSSTIG
ncbi:DUF2938 domain-containing protein [Bradyrhizobium sp. AS23.2]|uniref:DUF2938 domain-containing protein n=1 Tax=Bradyrhizobium sp. AS23.2 TaxID=1680155 RepID=UPI00093B29E5|nr:DUF2938 domain-containing protein [Bradyrhizobium sp. AS23.2]OKO69078.1 membrane protein [Bradyrhizobium sp. AS23.2]